MSFKKTKFAQILFIMVPLVVAGCSSTITGKVEKNVSVTNQTGKLENAGSNYTGPEYTIGIKTLGNKTPAKVLGIGEAATTVLVTLLKDANLMPMTFSKEDKAMYDEWLIDQQEGRISTGKNKDAADPSDSVDFIFVGAITSYSELEESSDYLLASSKTEMVKIGVDYRLIDTSTKRTLVAKSGHGEYGKKNWKILGVFGSRSSTGSELRDGALRDAMSKAVESMIIELSKRPFIGKILAMNGDTVIFKAGTRSKINPGEKLTVYKRGKALIDPDTNRFLGWLETRVGEVTLNIHQNEKISQGSISSGGGFRRGDILKH